MAATAMVARTGSGATEPPARSWAAWRARLSGPTSRPITAAGLEAPLLGAAAGAAVGNNIARSSTKSSCRGPRYAYGRPAYVYRSAPAYNYGYAPYYEQPYASGYDGYGYDSGYEPRHHRHHEHHDHDDDDDDH